MADCYTWLGVFGWSAAREAMPQARQAANRALQLDETLAAAHVSLGYVKALYDWDWPGAEHEFKRALELSPGDADAHFAYSVAYLTPLERLDEALAEIQRALALDPLSPYVITAAGMVYSDRRENDQAVVEYRKPIELDPRFFHAYDEWRALEIARGRPAAVDAVTEAMRKAFPNVDETSVWARRAAQQGRQAEARAMVETGLPSVRATRGRGSRLTQPRSMPGSERRTWHSYGWAKRMRSGIRCCHMPK